MKMNIIIIIFQAGLVKDKPAIFRAVDIVRFLKYNQQRLQRNAMNGRVSQYDLDREGVPQAVSTPLGSAGRRPPGSSRPKVY
ncbi:MAG: hypothetical protein ACOY46_02045 [Bacillota bacterium]